jgi:hypothetical protein
MSYNIEDINDYRNKITEEQAQKLINHCNRHDISPDICAWYDDIDDLFDDYKEHCDYTKTITREMLRENKDMFCTFKNGELVKLVK